MNFSVRYPLNVDDDRDTKVQKQSLRVKKTTKTLFWTQLRRSHNKIE